MKLLRKLKNKITKKLVIPQEYTKDLQLWRNDRGVFTTSYEAICAVMSQNSKKPLFYLMSKYWNMQSVLPARFERQKIFIESHFIPKLKKSDCLLDIGCANGEWTFMFAPFVREIMAYDYSSALIEGAKEIQQKEFSHIQNITFNQGDVSTMQIKQTYDCISFMGVLCYILEWEKVEKIIFKLYNALRGGGYMIYKDNTNSTALDFYFYNNGGYQMVARSRAKYLALFERVGFKIVEEKIIDTSTEEIAGIQRVSESYMCVLKKEY